jgi:hypothetical protein
MFNSFPAWARCLSLALLLAGVAAPRVADAGGLSKLKGKYSGVLVISQGKSVRILGNANVKVSGGKIVISGSISNVSYRQTITLAPSGGASVSSLLPGISGFNQSVTGRYSGKKTLTVSASFSRTSPGGEATPGNLLMKIGTTTFNSTLLISTQVSFSNGNAPVFVTVVAS